MMKIFLEIIHWDGNWNRYIKKIMPFFILLLFYIFIVMVVFNVFEILSGCSKCERIMRTGESTTITPCWKHVGVHHTRVDLISLCIWTQFIKMKYKSKYLNHAEMEIDKLSSLAMGTC